MHFGPSAMWRNEMKMATTPKLTRRICRPLRIVDLLPSNWGLGRLPFGRDIGGYLLCENSANGLILAGNQAKLFQSGVASCRLARPERPTADNYRNSHARCNDSSSQGDAPV